MRESAETAQRRFDNWKLDQVAFLMAERAARSIDGWGIAEWWLADSNRSGFEIEGPTTFQDNPRLLSGEHGTRYRFELNDDELTEVRRRALTVHDEVFGQ